MKLFSLFGRQCTYKCMYVLERARSNNRWIALAKLSEGMVNTSFNSKHFDVPAKLSALISTYMILTMFLCEYVSHKVSPATDISLLDNAVFV